MHQFAEGMIVLIRDTPRAQAFIERYGGLEIGRSYKVAKVIDGPDGLHLTLEGLPRKYRHTIADCGGVPADICEPACGCPFSPF